MADLRELLILVLALLIVFSLLRAAFVILRRRKGQIRLSIDKSISQSMEHEPPEAEEIEELPNGGARVVALGKGEGGPEKVGGNFEAEIDGYVPVLTDAVSLTSVDAMNFRQPARQPAPEVRAERKVPRHRKPKRNWKDEIHAGGSAAPVSGNAQGKRNRKPNDELDLGAVSMTAGERIGEPHKSPVKIDSGSNEAAFGSDRPHREATGAPPPARRQPRVETAAIPEASSAPQAREESAPDDGGTPELNPDQIIAIHVIAGEAQPFDGRELWDYLLAADLRYDDMNIFSKLESGRNGSEPVFRVANLVNPGTFDANRIDEFSTPGISMFMLLSATIDNMRAFEQMLAAARGVARTFSGHLLDSQRRELGSQAIEQARRRIREYELSAYGPSSVNSRI